MTGNVLGPGVGVRYKIDKVPVLTRKSGSNFDNNHLLYKDKKNKHQLK